MPVKRTPKKTTPPQEVTFSDADIRLRSYLIWEREGRPHGRDKLHWQMAIAELMSQQNASPASGGKKPARRKPAQKSAQSASHGAAII